MSFVKLTPRHHRSVRIFSVLYACLLTLQMTACGGGASDSATVITASTESSASSFSSADAVSSVASSLAVSSSLSSVSNLSLASSLQSASNGSSVTSDNSVSSASSASSASFESSASSESSSVNSSSVASSVIGYDTSQVRCDWMETFYNADESVGATSDSTWTCSSSMRNLSANGLPDHEVGTFPNPSNPNTIGAISVAESYTLTPTIISTTGVSVKESGYALNGVKFDPGTGGVCNNSGSNCSLIGGSGSWHIEALGQSSFDFGTDENNAHVQPGGIYHYHGMPEKFIAKLAGSDSVAMTLVGWARDGFPIYARYGHSDANDIDSSLRIMTSSYRVKATADANRPSTSLYPMGTFTQDYEYQAGSGDLDECNGRVGVTPEFPQGIYYYTITEAYPFIQRCVKGTSEPESVGPPPPL